jgi:formylglycine-generating enzyme required for sulfatase activity
MADPTTIAKTYVTLPPPGVSNTFKYGSRYFEPVSGFVNVKREVTVEPFALQVTPVTVGQYMRLIGSWGSRSRWGRLFYADDGRVKDILWGRSEASVQKKFENLVHAEMLKPKSDVISGWHATDPIERYVSPIMKLIPSVREFRGRFPDLGVGGEVYLRPDHPVVRINWYEAATFAFLEDGWLPSGIEWEFAARAGRKETFFGTDTGTLNRSNANFGQYGSTTPVKQHQPNPFGFHDMTGNVSEWVSDRHAMYGTGLDYKLRFARGGSYLFGCEISRRRYKVDCSPHFNADRDYPDVGFRIAKPIEKN